jgi:putative aldouronate transport system permease protein
VQTVSYLPHFISTVAIVGIVYLILSPQGGIINNILVNLFHIQPIYFLAETKWFRTIYIASGVWQGVGWNAIIYLAALSGVNNELYEAASIDGASCLRQMWHISVPAIQPTIIILLILNIGRMMSDSTDKVLLMQMPSTYEVSDVIGTYVYRRGLVMAEYSFGAAVGLFNSVINLILLISVNQISKKVSETSLW